MSLINRKERDRRTDRGGGYQDYRSGGTGGRPKRRGFAGPIIIACALVAVLVAADFWLNSGRVHRGVEVGNVSLGGMEPAEARQVVRAQALGPLHVVRTRFVVDRTTLRATLFRAGRPIWSAPVGVGAPGSPTPAGRFHVRERLRARGGIYGPWAFGTSAYSVRTEWPGGGVVGIHGTNQPGLLPGRVSNGCIRVRNADIARLAGLMPVGTPVHIR